MYHHFIFVEYQAFVHDADWLDLTDQFISEMKERLNRNNVNTKWGNFNLYTCNGTITERMSILQVICVLQNRIPTTDDGSLRHGIIETFVHFVDYLLYLGADPTSNVYCERLLLFCLGLMHPDLSIHIATLLIHGGADPGGEDQYGKLPGSCFEYSDTMDDQPFKGQYAEFMLSVQSGRRLKHRKNDFGMSSS